MNVIRGNEKAIFAVNLILKKVAREISVLRSDGVGPPNPASPFTPWVSGNRHLYHVQEFHKWVGSAKDNLIAIGGLILLPMVFGLRHPANCCYMPIGYL